MTDYCWVFFFDEFFFIGSLCIISWWIGFNFEFFFCFKLQVFFLLKFSLILITKMFAIYQKCHKKVNESLFYMRWKRNSWEMRIANESCHIKSIFAISSHYQMWHTFFVNVLKFNWTWWNYYDNFLQLNMIIYMDLNVSCASMILISRLNNFAEKYNLNNEFSMKLLEIIKKNNNEMTILKQILLIFSFFSNSLSQLAH